MTVPLIYINKKSATIEALRDYGSMKHILQSYVDDAAEARDYLTAIHSPAITRIAPGAINAHGEDGRICRSLDLIDIVNDRYQQALEYIAWFQPAWEALSDEECFILSEFFIRNDGNKTDLVTSLCERLCLERTQVYRRREKALTHLSRLLYGK